VQLHEFVSPEADASLLATLIIEKFCDHLQIYRQMTRFDRAGIHLARSTLLDWIAKSCTPLHPLYELKQEVLDSNYLRMHETIMKVMDKNKTGTTHRGYFWAAQAPPANLVLFISAWTQSGRTTGTVVHFQRTSPIGWLCLLRNAHCKKRYHFALLHGTRKTLFCGGRKKRSKKGSLRHGYLCLAL
jgi:hypothetical protein